MTTDAQLEAMCAQHVAGWTDVQPSGYRDPLTRTVYYTETGCTAHNPRRRQFPHYCSDPAAVIELLEKDHYDVEIHFSQGCDMWSVRLLQRFTGKDSFSGKAESFAEAGVRALLKAHGCEVGE